MSKLKGVIVVSYLVLEGKSKEKRKKESEKGKDRVLYRQRSVQEILNTKE